MVFLILFVVLIISLGIYLIYTNYFFQFHLHKLKIKNDFLEVFLSSVKGNYISEAYFASSHRIIPKIEYKIYSNREKIHFTKCYNVITFKTDDANWEFYFYLIKEGIRYVEVMSIRVFPKKNKIRSEGNVEKTFSRLSFFTNNRYLTQILEIPQVNSHLLKILVNNGDILLINHNSLQLKIFNYKNFDSKKIMDLIKSIHFVKNHIFKDDVIEY